MAQLAYQISNIDNDAVAPRLVYSCEETASASSLLNNVVVLGTILALIQVLDGILTACGMSAFSTAAEGNALLRTLMNYIGYIPALVVVKSLAIAIIAGLSYSARNFAWVTTALKGLIAFYMIFAIIPWTLIFINYLAD